MKALTRSLVALPLLAIALGSGAPAYADTIVAGQVGQNLAGSPTSSYSNTQNGSGVSASLTWSFTCSTCSGYGVSANGAATVNNGSLGASSSITVTGTPGGPLLATAASDAVFIDTLTITGGITGTSGLLKLTYALDGGMSNTGTGINSSEAYLYMTAASAFQIDNADMTDGGFAEIFPTIGVDNGTYNDTVTFYIPFTYGTAFATELDLDASALFVPADSTPYTATTDYYHTAALTSALVYDGTLSDPGTENDTAQIGSTSGLSYGPNGISTVPEPATWSLFAFGIGLLAFAKRRRASGPLFAA